MTRLPLLLITAVVWMPPGLGHPQCLDFRAPFQPKTPLNFCKQYSDRGCCGSDNEDILRSEYDYIQSKATAEDWTRCADYVKEILCQKCSPYAAHIFDGEGTSKPRGFPGLCKSYCEDFYDKCKNLLWFLDPGLAATKVVASKDSFCRTVALTDVDYCYPGLLTNPLLLRNLTALLAPTTKASAGCLCLEDTGKAIANPLWARHAGDGSGRLFVADQKGRVRIYNTQTKRWNRGCFLDFSRRAEVSNFPGDERGFLGMAFHPDYSNNGRFFVYYSTSRESEDEIPPELQDRGYTYNTKIRISELRVSISNPDKADMTSERPLLDVLQPLPNHNGGELMFGVDGYLYAFIGDGGGAGDPLNAGQNKSLLHGKVLRLDVDSDPSQPYTIPPDNPFVGEADSRPEIYAYGMRNPWRCGMDNGNSREDPSRGRIVCGDVGQNAYEEIDLLKKGGNYGWNAREGFECYNNDLCGNIGPEELPIHAYPHAQGRSVTGGVFYRGCESPALNGQYIYGDYFYSRLWSLTESEGVWTNNDVTLCGSEMCQGDLMGSLSDYILSFGEDEDGEIYVLTSKSSGSASCDGRVYKIVDPFTRNDPGTCNSDLTAKERVRVPVRSLMTEADKQSETGTGSGNVTTHISVRGKQSRKTKTNAISRIRIRRIRRRRKHYLFLHRRRRRRHKKRARVEIRQRLGPKWPPGKSSLVSRQKLREGSSHEASRRTRKRQRNGRKRKNREKLRRGGKKNNRRRRPNRKRNNRKDKPRDAEECDVC